MTKFVVRCLAHGTKLDLACPGRTPERAVWKAMKDRMGRKAAAYVVYDRKGNLVHTVVNR